MHQLPLVSDSPLGLNRGTADRFTHGRAARPRFANHGAFNEHAHCSCIRPETTVHFSPRLRWVSPFVPACFGPLWSRCGRSLSAFSLCACGSWRSCVKFIGQSGCLIDGHQRWVKTCRASVGHHVGGRGIVCLPSCCSPWIPCPPHVLRRFHICGTFGPTTHWDYT